MKGLIRHIPNLLTCISLIFGFYAAILGLFGDYFGAMIAIFIAAFFDFSDGLAARLLKAYSSMGKELDSLADVVSFGVAPGMILFRFLDQLMHHLSWTDSWISKLFLLSAFAVPVFSALRLAKFNIDDRQSTSFIGLPVPAHAIFWSSLIAALSADACSYLGLVPQFSVWLASIPPEIMLISLSVTVLVTSLLLVSEIPMFSLKTAFPLKKADKRLYLLLAGAILFFILFGITGIALSIVFYLLLSIWLRTCGTLN